MVIYERGSGTISYICKYLGKHSHSADGNDEDVCCFIMIVPCWAGLVKSLNESMINFFVELYFWGHNCSLAGLFWIISLLSYSMSFSRELKVSHWCCTPCPGYSCNYSFGGIEVQLCAQGAILNWFVFLGPNVVLPSFLLLPDFTKTSLPPLEECFGLAAVSFPSCVGRNCATAAMWLHFMTWSDFRSDFSRGFSLNSSYW